MGYYTSKLLSQVQSSIPQIGDLFGGGKVAYILQVGDPGYEAGKTKGLIVGESLALGVQWITGGNTQTTFNGGTSALIGKGAANTAAMAAQSGYTGGAAKICLDYRGGGYADWYLPSENEMTAIWSNSNLTGGYLANNYLWTSTEFNAGLARGLNKHLNNYSNRYKTDTFLYLRPVRSFIIS